jgi:hypothetical protein
VTFWPNLYIVGAMKSGTTTLHSALSMHPEICMSSYKEPCFFTTETSLLKAEYPTCYFGGFQVREKYISLFKNKPRAKYWGESSTLYTKAPKFSCPAQRIFAKSPNSKIIYIVRNPLDRIVSQYIHNCDYLLENRSFEAAVRDEDDYINLSRYYFQIEPYLRFFGKENVRITSLERYRKDPKVELKETFEWLSVGTEVSTDMIAVEANRRSTKISATRSPRLISILSGSKLLRQMTASSPKWLRRLGTAVLIQDRGLATEVIFTPSLRKFVLDRIWEDLAVFGCQDLTFDIADWDLGSGTPTFMHGTR